MRLDSLVRIACWLTFVLVSVACVPPGSGPYPPGPEPGPGTGPQPPGTRSIGTLTDIRGPNAFYERAGSSRAIQATAGMQVYEGDRIFTGQGTRMTLRFAQGGYAELDESTDPVPRFVADLGCLIVDLLRTGRMFVDGSAVCVGAVGTIARQDSQVVYDVRTGHVQITVAGGRAELRRPQRVPIPAGWRLDATRGQVLQGGKAYPLTRAQVEEAVRWTRWYQQTRPALPGTVDVIQIIPRLQQKAPVQTQPPPRDVIR
jgi:hypothetical protein